MRYTTDGSVPTKTSAVYKAPFNLDSTTLILAKSFDTAGNESLVADAYYRVARSGEGHGLSVKFYKGPEWESLPVFKALTAANTWNSFSLQRIKSFLCWVRIAPGLGRCLKDIYK
ncbi:MAG: chitobiase/beta-hexosaminidase C-terminal domain-containing protein [Bacteroidota bacterium]